MEDSKDLIVPKDDFDDFDDSNEEALQYNDTPPVIDERAVVKVWEKMNNDGTIQKFLKARKSAFVEKLLHLSGGPFSFKGRAYLKPIYDSSDKNILLKTSRQVEKCQPINSLVTLWNGYEKVINKIEPDEIIPGMDAKWNISKETIVESKYNGLKKCLRIKTRLGSTIEVTLNHPLRKLFNWCVASELNVGDRIASARRVGEFGVSINPLAFLIGVWIGDGHTITGVGGRIAGVGITQKKNDLIKCIESGFKTNNIKFSKLKDKRTGTFRFSCGLKTNLYYEIKNLNLCSKKAHEKFIPKELFDLSKESTIDLIRGLWATDGHCKNVTKSKVDLVYCSTSEELSRNVRMLLRKFGIVSTIRENKPSNKNGRMAFIVRVVGRKSIENFYNVVGPIPGKHFEIPTIKSNSNIDTIPREIHKHITDLRKSNNNYWSRRGFLSKGLIQSKEYCPTYEKIKKQNEFLKDKTIDDILNSEIIWDEIISIEDIGYQETWGIQTLNNTYVSNFLINHNTTFLGNQLVIDSTVVPYNKSMYVSPSHTQTRQFSNEKLKPSIEQSPLIMKFLQDSFCSTQVFEKGFTNGSYIFLRSAFRSADRTRGVSVRNLCHDKDAMYLTKTGWKKVSDITQSDLVADVNNDGIVEWNRPKKIIKQKHSGKMITFKHAGFHLRVTDYHRMWINYRIKQSKKSHKKDEWLFKTAIELFEEKNMGFKMTCKAEFEPESQSNFISIGSKKYNIDMFYKLIGWYLADGCITSGKYVRLNINEKKFVHVSKLLEEHNVHYCDYHYKKESVYVDINDSILGDYFKQLGTAYHKFIPRELFDRPDKLSLLLEGLFRGDACYHKGEDWKNGTLRTRSYQLAQDAQEAWLLIGKPAVIHERMMPNKAVNLKQCEDFELKPLYEVCSHNLDYMIFWGNQKQERMLVEDVENEDVYCITVKNQRPIVKGNEWSKPVINGNCLDEIQDFMGSEIPVILECTSHFPDARNMFAGTPKSYDNPIEGYWQESSQNEWLVPCFRHTPIFWNFLDERSIAPTSMYKDGTLPCGPVCKSCGKPIDVTQGRWMKFADGKRITGYRIPQLMVPWIIGTMDQWERLLWKRDQYPLGQFYNEVLGISYDNAAKPITRDEMIKCCVSSNKMLKENPDHLEIDWARNRILIAGVDWGEGNDGSEKSPTGKMRAASYTVLTIGFYANQKQFQVVFVKKYTGAQADPDFCVKDIARLCNLFNVRLVGVDWGHGWGVNNHLVRILGMQRVVQFQYLPKQKEKMKWDPIGCKYMVMRNLVMSEIFYSLKHQEFIFPNWKEMEPFAKDALAIFVEYMEFQRQMKYDHKPTDPDDWFHSLTFCRMAADIHMGKIRRT